MLLVLWSFTWNPSFLIIVFLLLYILYSCSQTARWSIIAKPPFPICELLANISIKETGWNRKFRYLRYEWRIETKYKLSFCSCSDKILNGSTNIFFNAKLSAQQKTLNGFEKATNYYTKNGDIKERKKECTIYAAKYHLWQKHLPQWVSVSWGIGD